MRALLLRDLPWLRHAFVPEGPEGSVGGRTRDEALATPRRAASRFGHAEVFAAIGLLSFLVARFVPVLALPWVCPMKAMAGIPCATCGMTHAFVHLARGDVSGAFSASPLGALLAAGAWLFVAADVVRVAAGIAAPVPSERFMRGATALGLAAVFANWIFLVVRGAGS